MIVRTGKVGAPVPAHVQELAEAQRAAYLARVAAQVAQPQPTFSPVTVGTSKRQIRRRNYGKRVS